MWKPDGETPVAAKGEPETSATAPLVLSMVKAETVPSLLPVKAKRPSGSAATPRGAVNPSHPFGTYVKQTVPPRAKAPAELLEFYSRVFLPTLAPNKNPS